MIYLVIILILTIFTTYVCVMDREYKKHVYEIDEIFRKDRMCSETYEYLISDEADKMTIYISSVCNTMGIYMESDICDDEEDCFY